MDLADIDYLDRADLRLVHPETGEELTGADGKPIIITLAGVDSPAFKAALRRAREQAEPEEAERALYAGATVAWSNVVFKGEAWKCDLDHALSLYKHRPWIVQQVQAFLSSRANFRKA
jgi:hypothetical protein